MRGLAAVPVGKAYELSRKCERDFVRRAKAVERAPKSAAVRRGGRMERALVDLQSAVALRVVAKDYDGADAETEARRLGDVEDEAAVAARWAEAERRVTLAAERGALAPANLRSAVDAAAGIEPRGDAVHGRGGASG